MIEHYKAVLKDLEQKRNDLDKAITAIKIVLAKEANDAEVISLVPKPDPSARYFNMSIRWAILDALSEAGKPMNTGEITANLIAGGIRQGGLRFNSNVSAVLSTMYRIKGEAEPYGEGYVITAHGREVWNGIKASAKYQMRSLLGIPASSEP